MSDISEMVSILLLTSFNIKKTHIYIQVGRMVFKRQLFLLTSHLVDPLCNLDQALL